MVVHLPGTVEEARGIIRSHYRAKHNQMTFRNRVLEIRRSDGIAVRLRFSESADGIEVRDSTMFQSGYSWKWLLTGVVLGIWAVAAYLIGPPRPIWVIWNIFNLMSALVAAVVLVSIRTALKMSRNFRSDIIWLLEDRLATTEEE